MDRAKGHHIVCYVVNLHQLKGIISTDLPGRFPFPSDLLNNYIFVLYDYDSNAILIRPIKSRDKSELIRGFQLCYDELEKANIKPIIHCLDNEISDDLIKAIQQKGLKHQIVTAHDHCQNQAEQAIQTFKSYLISNLHGTDREFPAHLWCRLLP